ncbi:hypothetical protein ACH5RR_016871 [Cinchona calisaya]|uniref:Sororin C-terminal region domain-containing protein n=1 Tax=Cinchona calisaya TaxID=153742 RepID=A0ABD2ZXB0_9GENT
MERKINMSSKIDTMSGRRSRKPLSELSNNFNLIPTPTLRNLISSNNSSSSSSSGALKSLLSKSQTLSNSLAASYSKQPHIPKSDTATSIGSSDFSNHPNPTLLPHHLPLFSSPATPDVEGNELIMYSRKRAAENLKGQKKTDVLLNSSTPAEKAKNESKAISVPSSFTPAEKAKHKGKATAVPFDSVTSVKAKDKGKATAVPFDSTPAANVRDKGKEISVHFRSSNVENVRDKGRAVAVPINSNCEEMEDKGKSTAVLINSRLSKKQKEKRPADAMVLSCPPLLGSRNTRNELNQAGEVFPSKSWTDPNRKVKKRKRTEQQSAYEYSVSPEFKQLKAYFDEVDAFELPVEEVSYDDSD